MNRALLITVLALIAQPALAARTPVSSPVPYTFTATDGANVSDDSTNWTEQNGVAGQNRIFSNAFGENFQAASEDSWNGTFADDQYACIKLTGTLDTAGDGEWIGVILRSNGAAFASRTMYRVYLVLANPLVIVVDEIQSGGAATQIGSNVDASSFVSGDQLCAEAITNGGNVDIKVYEGTTLIDTRSDTATTIASGDAGITGKKRFGEMFGDDFEAGDVTSGGGGSSNIFCGKFCGPFRGKFGRR